jgi:hypothetical protein
VLGSIGKLPLGGWTYALLHHLVGLQDLGYRLHYVERLNRPGECYDPAADAMTDDYGYALSYLDSVLRVFLRPDDRWSLIDRTNECHGADWDSLRASIRRADFVLTVADPAWFDELELCARRAFVDVDPVFTQAALVSGDGVRAEALPHYDILFTYAVRLGAQDCPVPSAGRSWLPARPVVATRLWPLTPPPQQLRLTAILHWRAGGEVHLDGASYGHKDRELERFFGFPARTEASVVAAIGGGDPPRERLRACGWQLVDPLEASRTTEAYAAFITGSSAELGIAKHAYVASRCGWFSDRSACYLAAGRPVLHQATGWEEWLPSGNGVFSFTDLDDAADAAAAVARDYERHAGAARRIAAEHFEAERVLDGMLREAGFR